MAARAPKWPRKVDAQVERLDGLARSEPVGPDEQAIVVRGLASKTGAVVAAAARVVQRASLTGFAPALVAAFERLLEDGAKRDPSCRGKVQVVETLAALGADAEALFRRGSTHVQAEPGWGQSIDTAAPLRVKCAEALVDLHVVDVSARLVDLLGDPEREARLGAVRAMARCGRAELRYPLRLKARLGDAAPDVTGLCFEGMLALDEDEGVAFVAGFLEAADPAVVDQALLALGQSRRPEAVAPIVAWLGREPSPAEPAAAYAALVSHRSDAATAHLVEVVKTGRERDAVEALRALATLAFDPRIAGWVEDAVRARTEPSLRALFEARFT